MRRRAPRTRARSCGASLGIDDRDRPGCRARSGGPASRYDGSPGALGVVPRDRVQRQPQPDRLVPGVSTSRPRRNARPGSSSSPSVVSGSTQPARLVTVGVELRRRRPRPRSSAPGRGPSGSAQLGGERRRTDPRTRAAAAPSGMPEDRGRPRGPAPRRCGRASGSVVSPHGSAKQRGVVPQRLAVGAPLERDVPARHGSPGYHLPWPRWTTPPAA